MSKRKGILEQAREALVTEGSDGAPDETHEPTPSERAQAIIDGNPLPPAQSGPAPNGATKPAETKTQRFRRLANRRVGNALDRLRQIVPLANRAQYEYSEEDVAQIREALAGAMADIARAFAGQQRERTVFSLR